MIVKHTNPCGIATRGDLKEAYRLAVSRLAGCVSVLRQLVCGGGLIGASFGWLVSFGGLQDLAVQPESPSCTALWNMGSCAVLAHLHVYCLTCHLLYCLVPQVRADPISAFGGIVAFNRVVDAELAKEIREFR